jgi:hypothetical protein
MPMGFTPLLALLIGEGYLNFGGGCKDVIMIIPWIAWSLFYLVLSIVAWCKKWSIAKGVVVSVVGATGFLALAFLVLLFLSSAWLGKTSL